jgi:protease-4
MAEIEPGGSASSWERQAIEKVALAAIHEQRRARQWGIFFKMLLFIYLFALLFIGMGWFTKKDPAAAKHTALVDLEGIISPSTQASAENIMAGLQDAFKDKRTQGVILRINSPGGSPVQAGHINDEIRRLRAKYPNIPLYAVIEDICASGGYYVATAADRIYVDKASIIGSIGVVMDGFGFTGTLEMLGVERRLLSAGDNKGFLDPFSPVVESQKEHAEMGLADALGSVDYVAREVIKAEDIVDFTPRENVAERLARKFGAGMAEGLARFGVGNVQVR